MSFWIATILLCNRLDKLILIASHVTRTSILHIEDEIIYLAFVFDYSILCLQ